MSTFTTVDFAAAARAMGAEGSVANTIEEFREQLGRARISGRPWVIDVRSSAVASPVLALSRINRPAR
jgi:thiamine pyrophosphate-dependent acetolactate synthase large subunit-like protein